MLTKFFNEKLTSPQLCWAENVNIGHLSLSHFSVCLSSLIANQWCKHYRAVVCLSLQGDHGTCTKWVTKCLSNLCHMQGWDKWFGCRGRKARQCCSDQLVRGNCICLAKHTTTDPLSLPRFHNWFIDILELGKLKFIQAEGVCVCVGLEGCPRTRPGAHP